MERKPYKVEIKGETVWLMPLGLMDIQDINNAKDMLQRVQVLISRTVCDEKGNMKYKTLKSADKVLPEFQFAIANEVLKEAEAILNMANPLTERLSLSQKTEE